MSRQMAHRYSDELPPARPTFEPIVTTWTDVLWLFVQVAGCLFVMVALLVAVYLMGMGVEGPR